MKLKLRYWKFYPLVIGVGCFARTCGFTRQRILSLKLKGNVKMSTQDLAELWLDRDLTWLEFNRRVLAEALGRAHAFT
jgi:hypothetical protein